MPKDKCKFQDCWLRDKKYQKWIRKKNDNTAYCTYCWKEISINHLGEPALKSHLLSKKHIERSSTNTTSSVNIQLFLPEASRESSESKASEGEIEEPKTQKDKTNYHQSIIFNFGNNCCRNLVGFKTCMRKALYELFIKFWSIVYCNVSGS